jgi:hypothetical protein
MLGLGRVVDAQLEENFKLKKHLVSQIDDKVPTGDLNALGVVPAESSSPLLVTEEKSIKCLQSTHEGE